MESQNQNHTISQSPSSIQNEPQATKEELVQINHNVVTTDAVGVDAGSDNGAKSEAGGSGERVKRGRGRPRKYEVGGNQVSPVSAPPPGFAIQPYGNGSDARRGRGRPRGSGKLQILASIGGCVAETAGGNLTPHVLTVNPGEDVISTIVTFFQKGPRAVCILSANGTVSSVTLRQPGDSGGFLRYEGRFEILSLTGSSTYTGGAGGAQRKNGTLSVSLAKPDGKVFGGGVENVLTAATPIQLILASFKQNISNQIKRRYSAVTSTGPNNPDSERGNLKVPKLTLEGEPSCTSPTSALRLTTATANGVADNVIPKTANGMTDNNNITPADDQNVHSDHLSGIDLDSQILQVLPVTLTDQKTSPDVDADANANASSVPQI